MSIAPVVPLHQLVEPRLPKPPGPRELGLDSVRVLLASEEPQPLEKLTPVLLGLGHEIVAQHSDPALVGAVSVRERPDVALVGFGQSPDPGTVLVRQIARSCPVVAVLPSEDRAVLRAASRAGVFGFVVDLAAWQVQAAIEIARERFAELDGLKAAFGRRATIEQAKGILMARHEIDSDQAFATLRSHSQRSGDRIHDVAGAIVSSNLLFSGQTRV